MRVFWTMRMKTFVAVLLIFFAAICVAASLFMRWSVSFFEKEYEDSLYDWVSVGGKTVDKGFENIYRLSLDIAADPTVKSFVRQGDWRSLSACLRDYKRRNAYIDAIYCFIPSEDSVIKSSEYHSVQEIGDRERAYWQEQVAVQKGMRPLFTQDRMSSSGKNVFLYRVPLQVDGMEAGVLVVTISERGLYYAYLGDLRREGRDVVFLSETDDQVSGSISLSHEERYQMSSLLEGVAGGRGTISFRGTMCAAAWSELSFSGYRMLLIDRQQRLRDQIAMMQATALVGVIFVLVLSAAFLYAVSRKLTGPVEELAATMKSVGVGNFSVRATVHGRDEIGYLAAVFNRMLSHIDSLVDKLADERAYKKEAELKALQYQIRPHFIYNTLNAIRLAAWMQGAKNIASLLADFIEILRASTNRKGAFAPLSEEIVSLKSYVSLQAFRSMDAFSVSYDFADEALGCVVPRLILQPLVENSILHAPSEEKPSCAIAVKARVEEHQLVLTVEDDGKGLSPAAMKALNEDAETPLSRGGMTGVGIHNIRDRLRLYYGEQSRLSYESDGVTYTRATIVMPASHDLGEYTL